MKKVNFCIFNLFQKVFVCMYPRLTWPHDLLGNPITAVLSDDTITMQTEARHIVALTRYVTFWRCFKTISAYRECSR